MAQLLRADGLVWEISSRTVSRLSTQYCLFSMSAIATSHQLAYTSGSSNSRAKSLNSPFSCATSIGDMSFRGRFASPLAFADHSARSSASPERTAIDFNSANPAMSLRGWYARDAGATSEAQARHSFGVLKRSTHDHRSFF